MIVCPLFVKNNFLGNIRKARRGKVEASLEEAENAEMMLILPSLKDGVRLKRHSTSKRTRLARKRLPKRIQ